MPKTTTAVKQSADSSMAPYEQTALIASQGPRERIAQILERDKLSFNTFEEVEALLGQSGIERWEVRSALAAGAAGVGLSDTLDSALGPCLQAVQTRC